MASREEEKQRRREERLAREEAAAKSAARRARLRYVFGGLAVVAGLAVVFVLVSQAGGGDDEEEASPDHPAATNVALPPQQIGELQPAAKAAGCEVKSPKIEGAEHETRTFTARDYKTNPPTSGNHTPDWYDDGIYEPGGAPEIGKTVHTLEHGRINVQYAKGASSDTIAKLEALLAEQSDGYHMLLYQNETNMPYAVAATAWGQLLGCKRMNDEVFDALRTFTTSYVDQGPEAVP